MPDNKITFIVLFRFSKEYLKDYLPVQDPPAELVKYVPSGQFKQSVEAVPLHSPSHDESHATKNLKGIKCLLWEHHN